MDNQTLIQTTYDYLHKQGCTSADPITQRCLYAGPNNTSCAVGFHIPRNDAAQLDATGHTIEMLIHSRHPLLPTWMPNHYHLLADLQALHDHLEDGPEFQTQLAKAFKRLARRHGVTLNVTQ